MAPPSIFACYAYNNGGCQFSEDECLFTHEISDPRSQYLQIRHPDLALKDVPIAEAAANAGFDCSNWLKLKDLIEAVHAVTAPVSYPDRWNGPAAFKSPLYPDHWTAAHDARQRKGVPKAYRDNERVPQVPAFVVSAAQILQNINNLPRVRGTEGAAAMKGTGSNRVPLGPVSGNKRGGDENLGLLSSSPKRLKNEQTRQRSTVIDLTQDDEPVHYVPTQRIRPRQASAKTTTKTTKPSKKQREARRRAAIDSIGRESVGTLAKIASKLRASAHAIEVDRETLRQRWEVDIHLQLQSVTDQLSDLNECFGKAEDGIRDALDVLEKRLL